MRIRGLAYRAHNPRWSFEPVSGEGAKQSGGRFNPRGMAALYTSLQVATAWLEAQQGFAFKAQPMTMCAYVVDCADMLDLTDTAVLDAYRIEPRDITCPWRELAANRQPVPSWLLAQRLIGQGIAGIRVPSFAARARPDDINLVFWRWNDATHEVKVIDPLGRLPPDAQSWR